MSTSAPDRAAPDRAVSVRDWLVLTLLLTASLVSMIDRFTLSLLLEPIKQDLALDDRQLGLLTGVAFGMFYASMSLPLGLLADRWSRKGTIMVGIGVWGVATAACGLAGNALQFAAARMFVGAGEAGLAPSSYALIYDRFPRRLLGRAMSTYQIGGMLGAGFALWIGGIVYAWFGARQGAPLPLIGGLAPWQQTFVAVSLPCLPMLLAIAAMREPARVAAAASGGDTGPSFGRAMADNRFLYATSFCGVSAIILVTYAMLSWAPTIVIREFGWSPAEIGRIYGLVVAIASVTGMIVGGLLVDMLTRRGWADPHIFLSLCVALICLVALAGFWLATDATTLLACAAVSHVVMAVPIGVMPAYVQMRSDPAVRSRISSVYVLTVNVFGLCAGPTAIGYVSTALGQSPGSLRNAACMVCLASLVVAIATLGWLWRRLSVRAR